MNMTKDEMVASINEWLNKMEATIGVGKYITGTLPAGQNATYDAPVELGYTTETHHIYSVGIELRIIDPMVPTNPPVIQATAVVDYAIGTDGKILFRNNYNGPVTYFARITQPLAK